MIVTAGLGHRAGALPLRGMGGLAAGASSMPRRMGRRFFDPRLAAMAAQDWRQRDAERTAHVAALAAAVAQLERAGHPPLRGKAEKVLSPYRVRKVVPLVGETGPGQDLDYLAMLKSTAFLKELDDLLEWADEEDWIIAFVSGRHGEII